MLAPGTRIADTFVQSRIGAGSIGEVYLANEPTRNRGVAIKVISPLWAENGDAVKRYFAELQTVARLRHPNIVDVMKCGQEHDLAYVMMEHLPGATLAVKMERRDKMSSAAALHVVAQVASALAATHARRIWHRDLKPENIFIVRSANDPFTVKLLDFGLGKLIGDEKRSGARAGVTLGAPAYLSPEEIEGGKIDGRADIYTLGCILFEMLVKRPPFEVEERTAMLYHHLKVRPPRLRSIELDTAPWVDALVDAMLEKDPARRPQTMKLVKDTIRSRLRKVPRATLRDQGVPANAGGAKPGWIAAAVLLPVAAATATWGILRSGSGKSMAAADPIVAISPPPTAAKVVAMPDAAGAMDAGAAVPAASQPAQP